MKLDFEAKLLDLKGKQVGEETLGSFLYGVLLINEQDMKPADKLKLARIAQKIVKVEDLTVEEVAAAKERALKYCIPSCILCVEALLEGQA
jgi:hypothetical protein